MVVRDGVCFMAMSTLHGGAFLTAFVLALGGSNAHVGLIASVGLLSQLMQLPGLFLVERWRRRRATAAVFAGLSRVLWIAIVALPLVPIRDRITPLILCLLAAGVLGACSGPAWSSLLRSVLPQDGLGGLFARRMVRGTVASLLLMLAAGRFIDWWASRFPDEQLVGYSLVFAAGTAFGLLGCLAIARTPEPRMEAGDLDQPIRGLLALPLRDANFRRLLAFAGTWNVALNLATPFFAAYMLQTLGLSLLAVTALGMVAQVAHLCVLKTWGRLSDRFSHRSVLAVCGPLYLLTVLGWTATGPNALTLPLLVLLHVLSGVSLAGVNLASSNLSMKLSPVRHGHVYMSVMNLVGAVAGAAAPLFGGVLADFFAARGLALTFAWTEPARQYSVSALDLRGLDFVFALSVAVGVAALRQLGRVREDGDVARARLWADLVEELRLPFRSDWAAPRLGRLAEWPIKRLRRAGQRRKAA
jgi:MFS family permease